jgi:hypothetical protein
MYGAVRFDERNIVNTSSSRGLLYVAVTARIVSNHSAYELPSHLSRSYSSNVYQSAWRQISQDNNNNSHNMSATNLTVTVI